MKVIETERLELSRLELQDAEFILEQLNDPAWLRYIGDRGVRTLEDAHRYLLNGPIASYRAHGFGLYAVRLKKGGRPMGLCGLLKRDWLEVPDIGFAFLPAYHGQGYAFEAATAVLTYASQVLKLPQVAAIASTDNLPSVTLLSKLGLFATRMMYPAGGAEPLQLFERRSGIP